MTGLLPGASEAVVFAAAVFVLNATPGVDFLLTVSRTLQGGARAGMATVAGINAGCVVHALAAAFGLAAVLAVNSGAFKIIQWAGAAYLVWLGIGMLRQAGRAGADVAMAADSSAPVSSAPVHSGWVDFRVGLLTNVLNPKVALFFLAFLPQFVPADSPSKTASFLMLGLWFVVQSSLFSLALVALAAQLSRLGSTAGARRALSAVGGLLFVALALRLLRERPTGP